MHSHLLETHAIGERLRRLPTELTPPLTWEELQRRAATIQSKRATSSWRYAAMAAGIAVAVAGLAIWGRIAQFGGEAQIQQTAAQGATQDQLPLLAMPDRKSMAQAEVSERWLSRLPVEPAVMRVGTRIAVADLEDRIAWMDDVLSAEKLDAVDPSHIVALQRERARLVNSLAQVRYAETLVAATQ